MLEAFLTAIAWPGDALAVIGSFLIGGGDKRGWWAFLAADFSLIGIQIYHHIWNQAVLFLVFIGLGLRGLINTGQLKLPWS